MIYFIQTNNTAITAIHLLNSTSTHRKYSIQLVPTVLPLLALPQFSQYSTPRYIKCNSQSIFTEYSSLVEPSANLVEVVLGADYRHYTRCAAKEEQPAVWDRGAAGDLLLCVPVQEIDSWSILSVLDSDDVVRVTPAHYGCPQYICTGHCCDSYIITYIGYISCLHSIGKPTP